MQKILKVTAFVIFPTSMMVCLKSIKGSKVTFGTNCAFPLMIFKFGSTDGNVTNTQIVGKKAKNAKFISNVSIYRKFPSATQIFLAVVAVETLVLS